MQENNVTTSPNIENLTVSPSPHVKKVHTTKWVMINVCVALLPACIMGVVYFGLLALAIIALSVASAVLSEIVFELICKKKLKDILRAFDFSSCVTGLLVAMTIGTNYPLYAPVLGSAFAIIVVKMLFGGTGKNIVNPAIAGRIFMFISFQAVVGVWPAPAIGSLFGLPPTSGATELAGMLQNGTLPSLSNWDLLLGTGLAGSIGETCKLALLVGAIYLAVLRIIDLRFPTIFVVVTGFMTVALNGWRFELFLPSILSGGLIIGAFFMATDYVTTPNTKLANYIYFFLLGIITAILRDATKMEVISFAILLMNLTVPLFDKFIIQKPFGKQKAPKKEAVKNESK